MVNPLWHNIRKTVFQNVKKDTIKPPSVKTIIQRINFFKTEFQIPDIVDLFDHHDKQVELNKKQEKLLSERE